MKRVLFLLLATSAYVVFGAAQCQDYDSTLLGKSVRYCMDRSHSNAQQAGEPVVYFFHGMYGSSSDWDDAGYSDTLAKLSTSGAFPNMTFVSFDTSGDSFFSDYAGETTGPKAYETWFVQEFIPMIESTYHVCHEASCRFSMGISMGGLGSIKTGLRHPGLFSRTAASCPALPPFNAYDSDSNWEAYFDRHPIGSFEGMFLLDIVRATFPTRELFDANDPSMITTNFRNLAQFPKLYFDIGGKDKYGFQEGVDRFRKVLDSRKIQYQFFFDPNADHHIYEEQEETVLKFLSRDLPAPAHVG